MAKYECRLRGDFEQLLQLLHEEILGGSISASYEDGSDFVSGGVRCVVRVYERYSWFGGNRVSLAITLLDDGNELFLSAITSAGSKALFFKINTFGEESFLDSVVEIVEEYKGVQGVL